MKKITYIAILFVMAASLLAGCVSAAPTEAPVATEAPATQAPETAVPAATEAPAATSFTVTDALDRTIDFDQPPTRIVICGKAGFILTNAAFLFAEAPERIVGYVPDTKTETDFIQYIYPQANGMSKLKTDSSADEIAALQPDLVLMKSYLKEDIGSQIEQLGIKVVYLNLETPEAINKDILTLGGIFGNSERADQLINLYDMSVKKITDVSSTLTDDQKPTVLLLQYSNKGGEIAFKVPPADWIQTGIVEMAGGIPVWKDTPTDGWTVITIEQIAAWNPQVILLVDYKGNALQVVNDLKADDKWALMDAVKNGKLYAFPLDFQSWDQPDSRWALGMTWVATKLHPDLFSDVKMYEEIPYFYASFYSLSDNIIQEKIMPLVKGDL